MIANDIVKDKGSVFFHPISRQVNSKKNETMPHTKEVHKGYLWPYSLTSRVGLGWPRDNDATRRHVARYRDRTRSVYGYRLGFKQP